MVHLIVQGVRDGVWALNDAKEVSHPVVQRYLREEDEQLQSFAAGNDPVVKR